MTFDEAISESQINVALAVVSQLPREGLEVTRSQLGTKRLNG
jgi:hypothetical protein